LDQSGETQYEENILRAAEWLQGMQSRNGGFAAFDADNTSYYLNEIPFADHGALLDPPTSDVGARVLMFLGRIVNEHPEYQATIDTCLAYLTREQEADGAWFGRWGTNYIYGTWSVLMAFESIGMPKEDARIQKAVKFLKSVQNEDGGWGEDNDTYYEELKMRGQGYGSTAVHTAWALLGLMAAGEANAAAVQQGIEFLISKQAADGLWYDIAYNAPGFPRVFYLKYHGYDKYFPLWTLARYRKELIHST
jgi:squalene-hopene/tetraprenyl-beta-curcumene cyclase